MKKILTSILCISLFYLSASAQISAVDLQGTWTLTALEGNDTAQVLSASQIQASTDNYLHDFPLTSTILTINGSDFSMTHHGTGLMGGTIDVADPLFTLHATPDGCSTCAPKDFIFIIRSQSATELVLDIFDEDQGSSTYARLTLTK